MATFLLVHGAWHGAWCWELVTPLLAEAGHRVIAPDLPGMGDDRTPLADVSVESWARFVADIASSEPERVILVGHSRGGLIIGRAAELAPSSVLGLAYLAAFMPRSGETLDRLMNQVPRRPESAGALLPVQGGEALVIAPDAVGHVFYNETPPKLVTRARERCCPEPVGSFVTAVELDEQRWGLLPRYYIRCTRDRAIAPQLQSMMLDAVPCRRVFAIESDHSPFYSAPEEVAEHLNSVALDLEAAADADHVGPSDKREY